MVNIQIRDVPETVRDTLAKVARSRGQSMQAYLRDLLEEDARRAANAALLRQVRAAGRGHRGAPGETARELEEIRAQRDLRNAGSV
jgi:predicted metal-dependent TIM-barrel fold hydrolase